MAKTVRYTPFVQGSDNVVGAPEGLGKSSGKWRAAGKPIKPVKSLDQIVKADRR